MKPLEQIRRLQQRREEDLLKRQAIERRALPKRIRGEMKAREMMFRESMRISLQPGHQPDTPDQERDKLRKFQEQEKKRYKVHSVHTPIPSGSSFIHFFIRRGHLIDLGPVGIRTRS